MEDGDAVTVLFYYAGVLATLAFRLFITLIVAVIIGLTVISTRKKKKKQPEQEEKNELSGNMNDYLDSILLSSKEHIKKLNADPLCLPDANKEIQKKILFVDLSGSLKTTKGELKGLSSIYRAGDATLELNSLTAITVKATVGLENMNFTAESAVRFRKTVRNIFMGATIKSITATVEVEFPFLGGGKPEAKSLTIDDIGRITLDIKKLGMMTPVAKMLGFVLLNAYKEDIAEKLTESLMLSINELVANVKIPSLL